MPKPYGHLKKFFDPYGRRSSAAANPYAMPTVGAVDVWSFDMASGSLVSDVKGHTYVLTDPNTDMTYAVAGPGGLVGVRHRAENSTGRFHLASQADTSFDVTGAESFVLIWQFVYNNTNADNRCFFDFGTAAQANSGIFVGTSGDLLDIWLFGGSANHVSRVASPAFVVGTFYTVRAVFNRASDRATITIKAEGGADTAATVNKIFGDFSAIGSITIAPDTMSFFRASNNSGSPLWGTLFQVGYAKGTTYDTLSKP
jgi:hypothetical protein